MAKLIYIYILSIIFFVGSLGFFIHLFIQPFFNSSLDVISADPYYFTSLLLGSSAGFFLMAPINVLSKHFRGKELAIKTLFIVSISFGMSAMVLNFLIYDNIISPNELIECKSLPGYKKNLLTDYVSDVSKCGND